MKKLVIYHIILVLTLVSTLFPASNTAYALEKTESSYTVTDSRQYPIIFIPGMAGSVLETAAGENAWPGSISSEDRLRLLNQAAGATIFDYLFRDNALGIINDEAFKILALNSDGKTPTYRTRLRANGTVRYGAGDVYGIEGYKITGDWRMSPIYQGFYDYMETQGYKLDENPDGKVFFDFAYDFRQDNHQWTKLLDKKVDEVLKKTKSDKVILVGHSMGGLQARLYMKDASRARKVAAVVFMGTPHHGSPMAFYSFTEGYNFGNLKLTDARMWEIAGNWHGGYQLLPDYDFIKDADNPEKPPVGIDAMLKGNWISTQEMEHYTKAIAAGEKPKIKIGFPNNDFAKESIAFHKELGDSVDKYPGVKYFGIKGTKQDTVQYVIAHWQRVEGLPEAVLSFTKEWSPEKQGDATVPLRGAQIKGLDGEYEVASEHGAIPSNADAQAILTNIRKQVNNEEKRSELVEKLTGFSKTNLERLRLSTPVSDSGEDSMLSLVKALALMFMRGTPDPEKIKLRDEIKGMAMKILRSARANITIAKGVEKDEKGADKPEHLYIVVGDYEVKDTGTGVITGAMMNITVDSLDTFDQALRNTDNLGTAYQSGKIKIEGRGIVNSLNAKISKWISKYVKFSRF